MRKLLVILILFAAPAVAQVSFHSSDKQLEAAFHWAQQKALSYQGKPGDPVGPWYESALPPRSAFCMRDVSHQCIGAEILGLHAENKNMLTLFARNISAGKDWCSYWEMNRMGVPAPEDYRNDREFWYNLDANFDLMNACWRMYLWTGDRQYISGNVFRNFHDRTVQEYIQTWILEADSLLSRPPYPNAPQPFNEQDAFHRCRGLPSYSEGVPHLKMGVDLVAALYRGMETYADILTMNGQATQAAAYRQKAELYRRHLESRWWDDHAQLFYTHITRDDVFGKGEGETFLLWFDALKDSARAAKTVAHLSTGDWNVENQSYFPLVFSRYGYYEAALRSILHLADSNTKRREYPEVSYGVIEGVIQGLMGVAADARYKRVSTLFNGPATATMRAAHIPLFSGTVTVEEQQGRTLLQNEGRTAIIWRAAFAGRYAFIHVGGRRLKALQEKDKRGNFISYAELTLGAGQTVTATVEN